MTFSDIMEPEIVLAVSSAHSLSRNIRTAQAAIEQLDAIYTTPEIHETLSSSIALFGSDNQPWPQLLFERVNTEDWPEESFNDRLADGEIPAALLIRSQLPVGTEQVRLINTPFPWQSDTVLNQKDKIFFLWVDYAVDCFHLQVCEMDCPTRMVGPVFESFVSDWMYAPHHASVLIQQAFAPTARVESADANSAVLLHRAGGLIVDSDRDNPARIRVGDVMQPVIRRDDRNGVPTLLQPLQFTFAAITESDGIKSAASVFAYSGSPGLRGRQNARTQRILLRVRPQGQNSQLQVSIRGNPQQSQSGCSVFLRSPLSDRFQWIGRTDWRGKIDIPYPEEPTFISPAAVHQQKPEQIDPSLEDTAVQIALNAPLVLLYVKSGEQVLGRLPFVPGLNKIEIAELPDDTHRLRAEAFIKGFQGEILDLIGQRNLLAARVQLQIEKGNLTQAARMMNQLRELKDFTEMNEQLSQLQRSILEQSSGSSNRSTQTAIDRMFRTTREMLQKHLQDETVSKTGQLLREATERSN